MANTNVTREALIEGLNEDLSREYQAIIAYTVYSKVLKGAQFMNIAAELETHAHEELEHALIIADQIDYLGGMPAVTPKPVKTSEKAEDMLRFDLDNENETIRQYRERVKQCEALSEYASGRTNPRHPRPGTGPPNRPRHRTRHRRPPGRRSQSLMASDPNGVVTIPSQHSVDDTVSRLERLLESKGVTLFAVIDHSGEAKRTGLSMPNTKLIVFGSPKAGTPLMLAAPTLALDLPLKLLVREDTDAKVWISYNSPEFLRSRHNLPSASLEALAAVEFLAANIAS